MAFCRFTAFCACEQLASNSTSDVIFKLVLENRAPRAGGDSRAAQGGRRPAHAGCAGRQARLRLSARSLRQVAPAFASHMPQTQPLTRFSNLCSKTERLAPAATPECRKAGKIAPRRRRASSNCRREGNFCVRDCGRGNRCKRCSTWARCPTARADCPRAGWPPRLLAALAGGHQQTKWTKGTTVRTHQRLHASRAPVDSVND